MKRSLEYYKYTSSCPILLYERFLAFFVNMLSRDVILIQKVIFIFIIMIICAVHFWVCFVVQIFL